MKKIGPLCRFGCVSLLGCVTLIGCAALMGCGKPTLADRYVRPDQILDFSDLFRQNCSGCHGEDGRWGPAPPLNDGLFQAIISDEQLTQLVVAGRAGTMMPAFASSHGGPLTDPQVKILVTGIRQRWGENHVDAPENLPVYQVSDEDPAGLRTGNLERGATAFAMVCATCHGDEGRGGDAGPITGREFGKLISDQLLRRIIITGRSDLEMPDYVASGNESELQRPLHAQEIIDIAAYMRSVQREKLK